MDFNAEEGSIFEDFSPENSEDRQKVYIETYGCQMNVNDSEVVASILTANGFIHGAICPCAATSGAM